MSQKLQRTPEETCVVWNRRRAFMLRTCEVLTALYVAIVLVLPHLPMDPPGTWG